MLTSICTNPPLDLSYWTLIPDSLFLANTIDLLLVFNRRPVNITPGGFHAITNKLLVEDFFPIKFGKYNQLDKEGILYQFGAVQIKLKTLLGISVINRNTEVQNKLAIWDSKVNAQVHEIQWIDNPTADEISRKAIQRLYFPIPLENLNGVDTFEIRAGTEGSTNLSIYQLELLHFTKIPRK